jgi:membrane protease YdiL (CAAX protease family)
MPGFAKRQVLTFLILTFALSSIFYNLIISAGKLGAGGGLYVLGLMWCPGIAALAPRLVHQRNLRGMGWGWGRTRYQAISYILPVLACAAVYGLIWATGIGGFSDESLKKALAEAGAGALPTPLLFLVLATLGVLQGLISATGEEVGWRGLLVPELAKVTSFTRLSLISGAMWSVYHYPVLIFADYNSETPIGYALVCFTLMVFALSFIFAWLRLKSGSLWTGAILHASHNLFVQQIFDGMTVDRGITEYVTTEFGIGLAVVYTVVAWYFWRRRGEVEEHFDNPAPDHVPSPVSGPA